MDKLLYADTSNTRSTYVLGARFFKASTHQQEVERLQETEVCLIIQYSNIFPSTWTYRNIYSYGPFQSLKADRCQKWQWNDSSEIVPTAPLPVCLIHGSLRCVCSVPRSTSQTTPPGPTAWCPPSCWPRRTTTPWPAPPRPVGHTVTTVTTHNSPAE